MMMMMMMLFVVVVVDDDDNASADVYLLLLLFVSLSQPTFMTCGAVVRSFATVERRHYDVSIPSSRHSSPEAESIGGDILHKGTELSTLSQEIRTLLYSRQFGLTQTVPFVLVYPTAGVACIIACMQGCLKLVQRLTSIPSVTYRVFAYYAFHGF